MEELQTEINSLIAVKQDSNSLTNFAMAIACYVSDMENNIGCPVLESVKAPVLMSKLLSKLDPSDNSDFGREMKREGKEETVSKLITWLHQKASTRSRGKANITTVKRNQIHRNKRPKKTENNTVNSEDSDDETSS